MRVSTAVLLTAATSSAIGAAVAVFFGEASADRMERYYTTMAELYRTRPDPALTPLPRRHLALVQDASFPRSS